MNKEGFHWEMIFKKKADNQARLWGAKSREPVQKHEGPGSGSSGAAGWAGAGRESALHLGSGGLDLRPRQVTADSASLPVNGNTNTKLTTLSRELN